MLFWLILLIRLILLTILFKYGPCVFCFVEKNCSSLAALALPVPESSLQWGALRTGVVMDLFVLVCMELFHYILSWLGF
jgi:hypothetical protein